MRIEDDRFIIRKETSSNSTEIIIEPYFSYGESGPNHEVRAMEKLPQAKAMVMLALAQGAITRALRASV